MMASVRQGGGLVEAMKLTAGRKAFVLKLNLALLTFFLLAYVVVLLLPFSIYDLDRASVVRCLLGGCHKNATPMPDFILGWSRGMTIGVVNLDKDQAESWLAMGRLVEVGFERVSDKVRWEDLFPVRIDEDDKAARCPVIPMPDLAGRPKVDAVVVEFPCNFSDDGRGRDVWRLQVHLVAAKVATEKGIRNKNGKVRVAARSPCRPLFDVFRCDDLVSREEDWWLFEVEAERLVEKLALPVGSCKLALSLEGLKNINGANANISTPTTPTSKREAYVTVIHSSDRYVCGAISLAQSLIHSGTTRDLILLHDASIPPTKLAGLAAAGWSLRLIERIRNPHARNHTYNEYNYSKLRLWQLTLYSKLVFIDSDIIVLRNLDLLFHIPQLSAVGNDGVIFNSGIMVVEPSNCTFDMLMERRDEIVSYNGGDQGFLNEVFVWWHRLPNRVNFLKIRSWNNVTMDDNAFDFEPPVLFAVHFLGIKPWLCYRDYDCNWNLKNQRIFASDAAHRRWWKLYDRMDEKLKPFCGLWDKRIESLERDRNNARKENFTDGHWKLNVTDSRQFP